MTKMYIDRSVVEKALEALKFSTPNPRSIDDDYAEQGWKEHIAANAALRTALDQQMEPVQELVAKMTAGRAVYFMERFKREEKLLGPNEQAALDFVISMLEQQAEPLTIERLRDALVASRIIDPAAVEDPDEYDDGVTLHRIEALHRRIT